MAVIPKRTKYRRPHRLKYDGVAKGNTELHYGTYGLQAKTGAWVTQQQIEAARVAMTRFIKRGGKFTVYMCGHTHLQGNLTDQNGRLHISFIQGGSSAEIVTLKTDERIIITKGLGKSEDRKYTY